jgi:glycogen operon protein
VDVWPGQPAPLGATYDGTGTNFAVYSEVAERVELCLFDDDGNEKRVDLPEMTSCCWHGHLPGVGPGQRYGFRVYGRYDPAAGHFANPAKLLVDPYAGAVWGEVVADPALLAYAPGDATAPSDLDSADFVPKAVVVDPWFDWSGDQPPSIPAAQTVIYEADVRALTLAHPDVPEDLRGGYAGLAHPAVVGHLTRLGVTAVNLRSVQQFVPERGGPLAFFAPHNGFGAWPEPGQPAQEFRHMVKALHAAGIEVLVDVAYDETAEAGAEPVVLSLRGIDNAVYYGAAASVSPPPGPARLDLAHPAVLRLVMDSLRHWVEDLHVDGFRFRPARSGDGALATLAGLLGQDPVLSRVKLIADPSPGDAGGPGRLPPGWLLGNRRYGRFARDYWAGRSVPLDELALRLAGSPDLHGGRRPPYASVNLIDAGDGVAAEARRSVLALLFVSQGVPVLRSGDELSDAVGPPVAGGALDWARLDTGMVEFIRRLAAVRRRQPLLQRRESFVHRPLHGRDARDFVWFQPDGRRITETEWRALGAAAVAVVLDGDAITALGPRGERIVDASLLLLLNASPEPMRFTVPDWPAGRRFGLVFDSAAPDDEEGAGAYKSGDSVLVEPRSVVLLRLAARRQARPSRTAEPS